MRRNAAMRVVRLCASVRAMTTALRRRSVDVRQHVFGFDQSRAQAFAQFLRGALGECRDQNLFDAQSAFEQQAQINQADGVCFSGAGARFDEHASGERRGAPVDGRIVAHAPFSARNNVIRSGSRMPAIQRLVATNFS